MLCLRDGTVSSEEMMPLAIVANIHAHIDKTLHIHTDTHIQIPMSFCSSYTNVTVKAWSNKAKKEKAMYNC